MINEDEIKKLNASIEKGLEDFHKLGVARSEIIRKLLDGNVKEVIDIYSNEVRNLAIISGTVAPFSLMLLGIEKLDVNTSILMFGFFLLILNIILSQFFNNRRLKQHDHRILKAELNLIFADSDLRAIKDSSTDSSDRLQKIFEYTKKVDMSENLLGLKSMDLNLQEIRAKLRAHSGLTNIIFSAGAFCIVLSVIINPFIYWSIFHFPFVACI